MTKEEFYNWCISFTKYMPNNFLGYNPPAELAIYEEKKEVVSKPIARTKLRTPQKRK